MTTLKEIEAAIDKAFDPIASDVAEIKRDVAIIREQLAKIDRVRFEVAGSHLLGVLGKK